jgi:hypothetical protein
LPPYFSVRDNPGFFFAAFPDFLAFAKNRIDICQPECYSGNGKVTAIAALFPETDNPVL